MNGSAKRRKPFLGIDSVYRADAYHWFRGVQERLMDNEARNTSGKDLSQGIAPVFHESSLRIVKFKPDFFVGTPTRSKKKTVGKVKSSVFETEYIEVVWVSHCLFFFFLFIVLFVFVSFFYRNVQISIYPNFYETIYLHFIYFFITSLCKQSFLNSFFCFFFYFFTKT